MTPELEERLRNAAAWAAEGFNGERDNPGELKGLAQSDHHKKHRKPREQGLG